MSKPPRVLGLHHSAWRCRNAQETRHFYEDLLGLPLIHVIPLEHVPSTGEGCSCVHLFFAMADGSCIAFFDLGDDTAALPSPNTPAWVTHLALRLDSMEELESMRRRLLAAGVEVLGPTDHHFVQSIYFFDPNGIRLELTVPTVGAAQLDTYRTQAHSLLEQWNRARAGRTL